MYERAPEIHQTSGLDAFKITHCRFSRQVSAEFGRRDLILLIELIYQFLDWFDFYNCSLNDWDLLCCHFYTHIRYRVRHKGIDPA
jgi:hypothetical protein